MSKPKQTRVAIVERKTGTGNRIYTAINREGEPLHAVMVYDCGHGAHLAMKELASLGYVPSGAAWERKAVMTYLASRDRAMEKFRNNQSR